jgi:epoxyqueuosine reductase QueG
MVSMREKIEAFIKIYVRDYKTSEGTVTEWSEPLVSFADATDSLFRKLKEVVDVNHFLPSDLLKDAKTVISYFIPFDKEIVLSNVKGNQTSKEWAISYVETNDLIVGLNRALSEMLKTQGFKSVVTPPTHTFDKKKLVSYWSHKHVAFVAGLGRFGIHKMLITEKGCCGRLGSMVTDVRIEPTKRTEEEFCLYKIDKSCGLGVKKCVNGALRSESFDRNACYRFCLDNAKVYSELGVADVCRKCVVDGPCSFSNPKRMVKRKSD